jgi:hypothetical protein
LSDGFVGFRREKLKRDGRRSGGQEIPDQHVDDCTLPL